MKCPFRKVVIHKECYNNYAKKSFLVKSIDTEVFEECHEFECPYYHSFTRECKKVEFELKR